MSTITTTMMMFSVLIGHLRLEVYAAGQRDFRLWSSERPPSTRRGWPQVYQVIQVRDRDDGTGARAGVVVMTDA